MSERVSKEAYLRILENRPFKFDAREVNYRENEGDEHCEDCVHFFKRVKDGWTTCEIFRNVTKKDEKPVDPNGVCDFFTEDGETFPLLDGE